MSLGPCNYAKSLLFPFPGKLGCFSVLQRPRGNKNLLNNVTLKATSDTPERMDYLIEILFNRYL